MIRHRHNGKAAGASQRNDDGHCLTGWEGLVEPLRGTACILTVPTGSPHAPLGTKQVLQHARHDGVISVQPQEARDWGAPVIVNVSAYRPNRPTSGALELGQLNRSLAGFGDETSQTGTRSTHLDFSTEIASAAAPTSVTRFSQRSMNRSDADFSMAVANALAPLSVIRLYLRMRLSRDEDFSMAAASAMAPTSVILARRCRVRELGN